VYKGILFDFDGTLARTMDGHFLAWQKACADFGIPLNAEEYFPLEGMKLVSIAERYLQNAGLDVAGSKDMVEKKEKYYVEIANTQKIEFYPGVFETIEALATKKIPMGIVTSSLGPRLRQTISGDFLSKFNSLITGDMVERGKPFPDSYLKGAEVLGLSPEICVAVENAPLGVQSAKAAGMYCVGIASTVNTEVLSEADAVVNNFQELSSLAVIKSLLV